MMHTDIRASMVKRIMKSGLIWLWVAFLVMGADRVGKYWALDHLILFEPLEILPFFNLTLAYNTGAAFSFLHNASGWQHFLLGGLAVIISICILRWLYKISSQDRWLSIALCLILAGALSNAWDRVLYSHVIDFLDFHWGDWHFAIFNLADAAICTGAFMLILHWLFVKTD